MTDKITIERETLERLVRWIGGSRAIIETDLFNDLRAALAAQPAEPVAWIVQNKNTGEVEIDEPFAKATNPKYWTDSFPVHRHAQPVPVVPEGYKLVPTELTSEMVKAFRSFCEAYDDDLIAGYKAMLAAAPQPCLTGNN